MDKLERTAYMTCGVCGCETADHNMINVNAYIKRLENALDRIRPIPEAILRNKPVRNLDEILSELDILIETRKNLTNHKQSSI